MANKSNKSKQNNKSKQPQQSKQPVQPEQTNQSEQTSQLESEQTRQPESTEQPESNKQPEQTKQADYDFHKLIELLKKYRKYIAAGALFILMVVILVKCTGPAKVVEEPQVEEEQVEDPLAEEFAVDAIPEVNQLITQYYHAYASGDVDALSKLADPISDTEKSYIQLFSEYVESYDNLSCYTKSGLAEGEYVVSVYLDMKFKDVATAAPGLDFFYIRTDETGKLYIDNAYSQFNQSNMETSTQADVQALINEFEHEEDVVALQQEVQQKYENAVIADPDLNTMATETIPNVITTWVKSLSAAEEQTKQPEETTDNGEETKPEESSNEQSDASDDEAKPEDKTEKTKTAYAMDTVNVRKGPSTEKEVVTQLTVGDKLTIYPDTLKDGWIKVKVGKKKGYVKREFVTTKKSKVPSSSASSTTLNSTTPIALPEGKSITLSESVNVRASMSETAERVGLAYQGDAVKVIQSYEEGWTKVEWNGQTGYIKTELIK
ncbi:MAG: SH3 domain-containing protein [bacterium]|nr:SH3 domain-containing protein [bacterium]